MHAMADHRIPQYSNELLRTLQSRPTINGSIKTLHDEFLVDEILPFEPTGTGEHLYIEIEKTGANTGWVAYQLASFLDVRDLDVSYAGRKDRHGVTTQWFSCYLPSGTNVDWKLFSVEGVVVNSMTWHRSKLRRGQLQCNVFQIKVRHEKLTESQSGNLVERLEYLSEHGFPHRRLPNWASLYVPVSLSARWGTGSSRASRESSPRSLPLQYHIMTEL